VRVPVWVTLGIAALVIGFGSYRIWLSLKPQPPAEPVDEGAKPRTHSRSLFAGGFYRMGKRTHLFVGIIYLLLGAALIATSFGFNPFGNVFGADTEKPAKDNAPTKSGVPIDQIPAPKK
jgi:hypothetical protein